MTLPPAETEQPDDPPPGSAWGTIAILGLIAIVAAVAGLVTGR